jgi:hypothetical protein
VKILTIGGFAKGAQGLVHQLLLVRRTVDHFHVRDQTGCGEVLHVSPLPNARVSFRYFSTRLLGSNPMGAHRPPSVRFLCRSP